MHHVWLHRYAVILASCTLLLLAAGGLVTSNDAGLAETASPGALFVTGHRAAGAAVGLLTIGLALFLLKVERRAWLRLLGLVAVALVIAQGLLGAFAVRWLLPQAMSVTHAVLAGLFFAATAAIAVFTSRGWLGAPPVRDSGLPLFTLAFLAAAAVLAQLGLGAAVRHNAVGLTAHVVAGSLAGALGLWTVWRVLTRHAGHAGLRRSALVLLSMGVSQAVLGMGAYLSRAALAQAPQPPPVMALAFSVSHVVAGAAALAAGVILAAYARQSTGAAPVEAV